MQTHWLPDATSAKHTNQAIAATRFPHRRVRSWWLSLPPISKQNPTSFYLSKDPLCCPSLVKVAIRSTLQTKTANDSKRHLTWHISEEISLKRRSHRRLIAVCRQASTSKQTTPRPNSTKKLQSSNPPSSWCKTSNSIVLAKLRIEPRPYPTGARFKH